MRRSAVNSSPSCRRICAAGSSAGQPGLESRPAQQRELSWMSPSAGIGIEERSSASSRGRRTNRRRPWVLRNMKKNSEAKRPCQPMAPLDGCPDLWGALSSRTAAAGGSHVI
jgi:hypothetical protein